jgi:hypothetical protein
VAWHLHEANKKAARVKTVQMHNRRRAGTLLPYGQFGRAPTLGQINSGPAVRVYTECNSGLCTWVVGGRVSQ